MVKRSDENSYLDEIIKNNLKKEFRYTNKSKSEIAKEIGVSRATISQYISGRIQPSLTTFAKLCRSLDCSADEILELNRISTGNKPGNSESKLI